MIADESITTNEGSVSIVIQDNSGHSLAKGFIYISLVFSLGHTCVITHISTSSASDMNLSSSN
jgi:hypothetical protein